MKILFIGASGSIGGEALRQCLAHPQVTSIVCFVRRSLPSDVSNNPKLQTVMIKDFSVWPEDVLLPHVDAAAMIWYVSCRTQLVLITNTTTKCYGLIPGKRKSRHGIPSCFPIHICASSREATKKTAIPLHPPQRQVCDSRPRRKAMGQRLPSQIKGTIPSKLYITSYLIMVVIQGLCEVLSRELAEEHASVWRALVLRPGGVITQKLMIPGMIARAILGDDWAVLNRELGAYFTYLAVSEESEPEGTFLIENRRIVEGGRKFLKRQASS